MGLLRRFFRSRKHQTPPSSPSLHKGETAGDPHSQPSEAEEGENRLKYTFPSPWADPSHETAVVLHHAHPPKAAAAAPQDSPAPCASCGQEVYTLRYGGAAALHAGRMVLSVLCVVLGVAVIVLLAVTWVLTRVLAVLEGVGVGREEEEGGEGVLVGVDVGGGEVVVLREGEGEGGGEVGGGDGGRQMGVALGYEFVEEVRPVAGREGRLAFAAARRAWQVCPMVVG